MSKAKLPSSAPYGYQGLDRILHEKARLSILSSLVAHPKGLLFPDLKKLCGLTDGNLSRHLQVLESAGLVEIWKGHRGSRPQTLARLTEDGRKRFLDYIALLEQIVCETLEAAQRKGAGAARAQGWSTA